MPRFAPTVLLVPGPVALGLVALVAVAPALIGQQQRPRSLFDVIREGKKWESSGDLKKACDLYRSAAGQFQDESRKRILRELARVLTQMKEYPKAIQTHEEIMGEYGFDDYRRYTTLGTILRLAQNIGKQREYVDKARTNLDRVLKQAIDKKDADALTWRTRRQLAEFCFSMGWYKEAIADYNAALPLAPKSDLQGIHHHLLLSYENLGDYEGIIRESTALLSLGNPQTHSPYREKLAAAYLLSGEEAKGIAALADADVSAVVAVAERLITAGQYKSCETLLRSAIEKDPDDPRLLCSLAKLRWAGDRCDEALDIYLSCYHKTAADDRRLFDIASSISSIHIDKKDIDEAAAAGRKRLEALLAQADPSKEHRDAVIRSLLLAGLMEDEAGDCATALDHLSRLNNMLRPEKALSGLVRKQITKTAIDAVGDSLAAGRWDEAERWLGALDQERFSRLAKEYAEYVILDRRGLGEEAAAKLQRIRTMPPMMDGSHSYAAYFLAQIGLMDLAATEWKRTLAMGMGNGPADRFAAIRLAEHYSEQEDYAKAIRWFDKASSIKDQNAPMRQYLYWHRRELETRLKAANGDPDVVAAYLKAPELSYRAAAAGLLAEYGTPKHIPLLVAAEKDMPKDVQAQTKAAIVGIKGRFHFQLDLGLQQFDENRLKETLIRATGSGATGSGNSTLLWMKPDPFDPNLIWLGLRSKNPGQWPFVVLADKKLQALHTFPDFGFWIADFGFIRSDSPHSTGKAATGATGSGAMLPDSDKSKIQNPKSKITHPTPTCIAFAKDAVWVGTDRGVFAYNRKSEEWSQYAIMGKTVDAPIDMIEQSGEDWVFTVTGQGKFSFSPSQRTWKKE